MSPEMRQAMDPMHWKERIQSGEVDRRLYQSLGNVDQLLGIINGTGPGGAAWTNQAAIDVMKGSSPIWQLGSQLSPAAQQLDARARCRAAGTCQ